LGAEISAQVAASRPRKFPGKSEIPKTIEIDENPLMRCGGAVKMIGGATFAAYDFKGLAN
jgi:hypothetical protein